MKYILGLTTFHCYSKKPLSARSCNAAVRVQCGERYVIGGNGYHLICGGVVSWLAIACALLPPVHLRWKYFELVTPIREKSDLARVSVKIAANIF